MDNFNLENLSAAEKQFLESMIMEDAVYDEVISKLNIDSDDAVYRAFVFNMLKKQARDRLVFFVWKNLEEQQLSHLRDYIDQSAVTMPELDSEEVLVRFAMQFPTLKQKVFSDLADFFVDFIKRFNELKGA